MEFEDTPLVLPPPSLINYMILDDILDDKYRTPTPTVGPNLGEWDEISKFRKLH